MLTRVGAWRRFLPHRKAMPSPQAIDYDIYETTARYVERRLPNRRPRPHQLDKLVTELRGRAEASGRPEDWLAALYAQAPGAAEAQQQMDQHPYGYRDKRSRVYELIDFNDTFVATVLAMNEEQRTHFAARAKIGCDRACERMRMAKFSDEQWMAIVRGLTREIAIFRAARDRGFDAVMPNRTGDALGVDVQVRDPESGRYINIDVKTPSSFRHRLEDLVEQGRLTEQELLEADSRSYCIEHNGHDGNSVEVVLLCILPDKFGEFGNFRLQNSEPMRQMLNLLIREHGLSDDRYGIYK